MKPPSAISPVTSAMPVEERLREARNEREMMGRKERKREREKERKREGEGE